MLRQLCTALLAIVSWSTASAATLSVSSDKLTYLVGEIVTLTVIGDDGDASAYGIYGRLIYSGTLVDNGTRTQTLLVGEVGDWNGAAGPPPLAAGDDGINAYSEAFNQIASGCCSQTALNLPGVLSTVTLIATAVGLVDVDWNTVGGYNLIFFGLTSAPGTSFTIIPEPHTATLLGLGLLGLSVRRKVRT